MCSMCASKVFLCFAIIISGLNLVSNLSIEQNETACFSSDSCGFYNLECPPGQIIKITQLWYGWKPQNDPLCINITTHCDNADHCCSYNDSDLHRNMTQYQAYGVFKRCSGKRMCKNVRATQTYLNPVQQRWLSTYVIVNYVCVNKNSSLDMCLNRTFRGNDLNVIFDPLTALTGVTKRRQILCSCKVISPESFNTTLIDARIACNKTIYCEAPLVSGIPDLNSQCVNKEQDFEYFHHNVDHGSGIGPEFNITFDSLCPPEHLWLALSGLNKLSVICRRFLLDEVTTTTTSTTTSTTTITTTTAATSKATTANVKSQSELSNVTKTSHSTIRQGTTITKSQSELSNVTKTSHSTIRQGTTITKSQSELSNVTKTSHSTIRQGTKLQNHSRTNQHEIERTTTASNETAKDRHTGGQSGPSTELWIAIGGGAAGIIVLTCIGVCCWGKRSSRIPKATQLRMENLQARGTK